jgi:hypothetical protein
MPLIPSTSLSGVYGPQMHTGSHEKLVWSARGRRVPAPACTDAAIERLTESARLQSADPNAARAVASTTVFIRVVVRILVGLTPRRSAASDADGVSNSMFGLVARRLRRPWSAREWRGARCSYFLHPVAKPRNYPDIDSFIQAVQRLPPSRRVRRHHVSGCSESRHLPRTTVSMEGWACPDGTMSVTQDGLVPCPFAARRTILIPSAILAVWFLMRTARLNQLSSREH